MSLDGFHSAIYFAVYEAGKNFTKGHRPEFFRPKNLSTYFPCSF